MLLSVIIPTFNRADILRECLQALIRQDFPRRDFEIIVVDDGSRDHTRETLKIFEEKYPQIRSFTQKNQGQGVARNLGIRHAKGQIVVLIGDDIIVEPNFLNEHMRFHLHHGGENEAVLGFTTWHPKLEVNAFMRWMTNGSSVLGRFGGHQFAYEKLAGKTEADYNFFYTSNISLKTSLLKKYPFDPLFSGYGWEDIELGYRLYKHERLRIYYNPAAIGYHDHLMDAESLRGRMIHIGESAWVFHRKYPELHKVPRPFKWFMLRLISCSWAIAFFKITSKNIYYYTLSKKYFLEGLKQGKKRLKQLMFA